MFNSGTSRMACRIAAAMTAMTALAAPVTVIGLATGPASAARASHAAPGAVAVDLTWDVTNSDADGSFTAVLTDTSASPPVDVTCAVSEIMAMTVGGTDLPYPVVSFTVTFSNCTGPLGSTGTGTLTGEFYPETSTSGSPSTVNGYIVVESASVTINSILGTCTAPITPGGTVGVAGNEVTYDYDTGLLEIPVGASSTLSIDTATGDCAGLVNTGDSATLSGSWVVTT